MPRSIRFIPEGGALVEVTDRTVQARFLLVPSRELNEIVGGVLCRAQRLYKVRICGFDAMTNHFHALLWVDEQFTRLCITNHASNRAVCCLEQRCTGRTELRHLRSFRR